jgi:hypothetical protein
MGSYFENFNNTGIVIPHQDIHSNQVIEVFPDYFDETKFNLLHAGSLMKQRNPKGLIEAFQLFLKNNPDAKNDSVLLLIGHADYHKSAIENYKPILPNLYTNLSNVPFNEVQWLQQHASVNIVLEADSEMSPFLPGKFPHCIFANKPILHLGPKKSETIRLLGENYPYTSTIIDRESISTIIENMYKIWSKNKKSFLLNRPDLEAYLGKNHLKEQLENVLNDG